MHRRTIWKASGFSVGSLALPVLAGMLVSLVTTGCLPDYDDFVGAQDVQKDTVVDVGLGESRGGDAPLDGVYPDVPGPDQGDCVNDDCGCQPDCAGKGCGDDGCGGSCGSCSACESVCTDGQCGPALQADSGCHDGDIYWKDSCDAWGEKKIECEAAGCAEESKVCTGCEEVCAGRECGAQGKCDCGKCPAGESCDEGGQCGVLCGDGACADGLEDYCSCAQDCVASTCAGCCTGTECKGGDTTGFCGVGGESCDACTGGQVCTAGDCGCTSQDHKECAEGDVYWFDSCGVQGVKFLECGETACLAGVCKPASCPDGFCNGTETCCTCSQDCGTCCGNGACDCGETSISCPGDCAGPVLTEGFVAIDAGTFWMGSPGGEGCPVGYTGGGCNGSGSGTTVLEPGRYSQEALHQVTLTVDFELQIHELTQGEWKAAFGGWNPSGSIIGDTHPIETISWYDSLVYANWKSIQEGYAPCYQFTGVECEQGGNPAGGTDAVFCLDSTHGGINAATVTLVGGASKPQECAGYRLPTDAEWEYAARAGTTSAYHNGQESDASHLNCEVPFHLTDIAWYCGNNSPGGTKAVGGKQANAWGLKDMSGNVYEWCWDKYCTDTTGYGADPDGSSCGGSVRVKRGGFCYGLAQYCRSAYRYGNSPGYRDYTLGLRLARSF